MIAPSIGRVIWFHPSKSDTSLDYDRKQPLAALVAYVHSDRCINIGGFTANGVPFSRTSVRLLQDGEEAPENGYYAEWMPFQKGQAAKHDADKK